MGGQIYPVTIVQGGQWGSEGKGGITEFLCRERNIKAAVRTGAINAGHTLWYEGREFKMQQIPCGWTNPDTHLVIGPGAYIHPEVLMKEIDLIEAAIPGVRKRLWIDHRAGVHLPRHEGAAADANRHHRIGATGKGCSEAIVDKIRNRNAGAQLFRDIVSGVDPTLRPCLCDTQDLLLGWIDGGKQVLIEGTQGTFLDMHLGPYPFTTSRMTSAANWVAECGLPPSLEYEVVLVLRTFPIRVAGNSGPMPGEISWLELAQSINGRLQAKGAGPRVDPLVLDKWAAAVERAASKAQLDGRYPVPAVGGPEPAHWNAATREQFRVAASEIHRDAFGRMSTPDMEELRKLFEFTTVTRKLRRVAQWDTEMVEQSIRWNRPTWIALTFLNYWHPELWGKTTQDSLRPSDWSDAAKRVRKLEKDLGTKIGLVSTGPMPNQTFDLVRAGSLSPATRG